MLEASALKSIKNYFFFQKKRRKNVNHDSEYNTNKYILSPGVGVCVMNFNVINRSYPVILYLIKGFDHMTTKTEIILDPQ